MSARKETAGLLILGTICLAAVAMSSCAGQTIPAAASPPPPAYTCTLEASPELPTVTFTVGGAGEGSICVDPTNTAALAERERRLESWIRRACLRCGCGPATASTTTPDLAHDAHDGGNG